MTSEVAEATALTGESRVIDWSDESGTERDLVRAILAQRLDQVRVTSLSLERIERFHKLGFPSTTAEPLLLLRAPQNGGGETEASASVSDPADASVAATHPQDDAGA